MISIVISGDKYLAFVDNFVNSLADRKKREGDNGSVSSSFEGKYATFSVISYNYLYLKKGI